MSAVPSPSIETIQHELTKLDNGRYKLEKIVGSGSYGIVMGAFDTSKPDGSKVAIKRISEVLKDAQLSQRIFREVSLLAHFRHHPNVMGILDVLCSPEEEDLSVLFIVMPLMNYDLNTVLRTYPPSEQHIKFFIYQLLCGLLYIHKANVIHRDITPSNLLLTSDCDLVIADFGLARPQMTTELTDYVATRWFRAPELVMEDNRYTDAVDVWSTGCVMAQLFSKGHKPVFPGEDRIKQLGTILEIIGTPSDDDIVHVGSEPAQNYIKRHYANLPGVDFKERFRVPPEYEPISDDASDLLKRMLEFNPRKRISVLEAMRHCYLADFYDPEDENIPANPVDLSLFDVDCDDVNVVKKLIRERVKAINEELANDTGSELEPSDTNN